MRGFLDYVAVYVNPSCVFLNILPFKDSNYEKSRSKKDRLDISMYYYLKWKQKKYPKGY